MKKIYRKMNLQRFEGGEGGQGGAGGNGGGGQGSTGATYSFEQAEEIANARADKASRAALANYFRSQGMTEDEITTAINDFKEKKKANTPDLSKVEKERDGYKAELDKMKNENLLTKKGVRAEDLDYVSFKVSAMVTDKKNFEAAATEFLKENPRFLGGGYRVSGGIPSGGNGGSSSGNKNEQINNMLRNAFGR